MDGQWQLGVMGALSRITLLRDPAERSGGTALPPVVQSPVRKWATDVQQGAPPPLKEEPVYGCIKLKANVINAFSSGSDHEGKTFTACIVLGDSAESVLLERPCVEPGLQYLRPNRLDLEAADSDREWCLGLSLSETMVPGALQRARIMEARANFALGSEAFPERPHTECVRLSINASTRVKSCPPLSSNSVRSVSTTLEDLSARLFEIDGHLFAAQNHGECLRWVAAIRKATTKVSVSPSTSPKRWTRHKHKTLTSPQETAIKGQEESRKEPFVLSFRGQRMLKETSAITSIMKAIQRIYNTVNSADSVDFRTIEACELLEALDQAASAAVAADREDADENNSAVAALCVLVRPFVDQIGAIVRSNLEVLESQRSTTLKISKGDQETLAKVTAGLGGLLQPLLDALGKQDGEGTLVQELQMMRNMMESLSETDKIVDAISCRNFSLVASSAETSTARRKNAAVTCGDLPLVAEYHGGVFDMADEFSALKWELLSSRNRPVLLHGPTGAGKSRLVHTITLDKDVRLSWNVITWVNCGSCASREVAATSIMSQVLHCIDRTCTRISCDFNALADKIRQACGDKRVLFILRGCKWPHAATAVARVLCNKLCGLVLVSSDESMHVLPGFQRIRCEGALSTASAALLIKQRAELRRPSQSSTDSPRFVRKASRLDVSAQSPREKTDMQTSKDGSEAAPDRVARQCGFNPLLCHLCAHAAHIFSASSDCTVNGLTKVMGMLPQQPYDALALNEVSQIFCKALEEGLGNVPVAALGIICTSSEALPLRSVSWLLTCTEAQAVEYCTRLQRWQVLRFDGKCVRLLDGMDTILTRGLASNDDVQKLHQRLISSFTTDINIDTDRFSIIAPPKSAYFLVEGTRHLAAAGWIGGVNRRKSDITITLRNLLLSPAWLFRRIRRCGGASIVADFYLYFDLVHEYDGLVDLLLSAVKHSLKSTSLLRRGASERALTDQLVGRLQGGEMPPCATKDSVHQWIHEVNGDAIALWTVTRMVGRIIARKRGKTPAKTSAKRVSITADGNYFAEVNSTAVCQLTLNCMCSRVRLAADGRSFAIVNESVLRIFSVDEGAELQSHTLGSSGITGLWSGCADSISYYLAACEDGSVYLVDSTTGAQLLLCNKRNIHGGVWSLAPVPQNHLFEQKYLLQKTAVRSGSHISLYYSEDGTLHCTSRFKFACGCADGYIRFFSGGGESDATEYFPSSRPFKHFGGVSSLCFNAAGSLMLSASWDQSIKVWNLMTGLCAHKLVGHEGPVVSAIFSADEKMVITASEDKRIGVWSLDQNNDTCRMSFCIVTESWMVQVKWANVNGAEGILWGNWGRSMCFVPATSLAMFMSHAKELAKGKTMEERVVDRATYIAFDLLGGSSLIGLDACTAGTGYIVSVQRNGEVHQWSLPRTQLFLTHRGLTIFGAEKGSHVLPSVLLTDRFLQRDRCRDSGNTASSVTTIAACPSGRILVGKAAGGIEVRRINGAVECVILPKISKIRCIAINNSGRRALIAAESMRLPKVVLLDNDDDGCPCVSESCDLFGHTGATVCVDITYDGRRGITGSSDSTARVWQLEKETWLKRGPKKTCVEELRLLGHSGTVTGVAMVEWGRLAVSCSQDESMRLWNLNDAHSSGGVWLAHCARIIKTGQDLCGLCIRTRLASSNGGSADDADAPVGQGYAATAATSDGFVRSWDLASGEVVSEVETMMRITCLDVASSKSLIMTCSSSERNVHFWNSESGKEAAEFMTDDTPTACCFSHFGTTAYVGTADGQLRTMKLRYDS